MKKIIFLFLMFFAFAFANGQKIIKSFDADTVKANIKTYSVYSPNNLSSVRGIMFAQAKLDTISGALNSLILYGTNDNVLWFGLDTLSTLSGGNYQLYDYPAKYAGYRLGVVGGTGDTIKISNVKLIYKE